MKRIVAATLALFLASPIAAQAASFETSIERGVNFRSEPSTKAYIYRTIKKGENVHVINKTNNYWLKVKTKDGTVGYISADPKYTNYNTTASKTSKSATTSNTSSTNKADRIVSLAKSLSGRVTYDYGTRNPSKYIFDCSSFTEYVFEQNGISLPWGTKLQKSVGQAVSKSKLKKGDLVFFSTSGSGINHVGIYIGGGEFIHNKPSTNGVAIDNLNKGYWSKAYESARRVL